MRGVRQLHRLDRRAELARQLERGVEALEHAGLDALARQLLGHAEPDAGEVGRGRQRDRLGQADRGRVARVLADHRAEQQRGVGDVAGQRAGLVQRGGEGDHPVARDRAVGGLHPDDPAQRGGLADRAAGVGADRPRREARGHGGGAAARGAARARACGPTGSAWGRRRSARWRSPSRTRPGWSCPAPARPSPAGARRPSPCRAGGSRRGCASPPGSGTPSVQKRSLTATGTPPSGDATSTAGASDSATHVNAFSSSAAARSR